MNRIVNSITIDNKTARIDWYEAPTIKDLIEAVEEIVRSPRFSPDLQLLIVDHATDFDIHPPQIREAVAVMAPHVKMFKSAAFSVQTDNHYGIANQFRSYFLMAGVAIEIIEHAM